MSGNEEPSAVCRNEDNEAQVQRQLQAILESAHFKNSKRCKAFLQYTVENTLAGSFEQLKERVIGAAIFGREIDYDTNQDSVVRNAAADVRKRLAQYYDEQGAGARVRIELSPGAYIPEFRFKSENEPAPGAHAAAVVRYGRRRWWLLAVAAAGVAIVLALWFGSPVFESDLDLFWAPLWNGNETIQICVGQPTRLYEFTRNFPEGVPRQGLGADDLRLVDKHFLFVGDALAFSDLAALIHAKGKHYRFRSGAITPYSDLRGNPVVLIGAYNNQWTLQLTSRLRFYFDGTTVRDRHKHSEAVGVGQRPDPPETYDDYAIISRVLDASTERTIVSVAGASHKGTWAAADLVSNPAYFHKAVQAAPSGWFRRDIQFVLRVRVVGGTPGPPEVVATHFW